MKQKFWSIQILILLLVLGWLNLITHAQQPNGILWESIDRGRITAVSIGGENQQVAFGSSDEERHMYLRARTEWVGLDNFRYLYRDRFFGLASGISLS